jgi:hypothetical protein
MGSTGTPSPEFQALIDQATVNENTEDSAAALIVSLGAKVADLAGQLAASPTKQALLDLAAGMKAHADPLAAAVVAGGPAA